MGRGLGKNAGWARVGFGDGLSGCRGAMHECLKAQCGPNILIDLNTLAGMA